MSQPPPDGGLIGALHVSGPAEEHAAKLMLFGQFVGSWDLEWAGTGPDGEAVIATGELHFGWTLGGRAVTRKIRGYAGASPTSGPTRSPGSARPHTTVAAPGSSRRRCAPPGTAAAEHPGSPRLHRAGACLVSSARRQARL